MHKKSSSNDAQLPEPSLPFSDLTPSLLIHFIFSVLSILAQGGSLAFLFIQQIDGILSTYTSPTISSSTTCSMYSSLIFNTYQEYIQKIMTVNSVLNVVMLIGVGIGIGILYWNLRKHFLQIDEMNVVATRNNVLTANNDGEGNSENKNLTSSKKSPHNNQKQPLLHKTSSLQPEPNSSPLSFSAFKHSDMFTYKKLIILFILQSLSFMLLVSCLGSMVMLSLQYLDCLGSIPDGYFYVGIGFCGQFIFELIKLVIVMKWVRNIREVLKSQGYGNQDEKNDHKVDAQNQWYQLMKRNQMKKNSQLPFSPLEQPYQSPNSLLFNQKSPYQQSPIDETVQEQAIEIFRMNHNKGYGNRGKIKTQQQLNENLIERKNTFLKYLPLKDGVIHEKSENDDSNGGENDLFKEVLKGVINDQGKQSSQQIDPYLRGLPLGMHLNISPEQRKLFKQKKLALAKNVLSFDSNNDWMDIQQKQKQRNQQQPLLTLTQVIESNNGPIGAFGLTRQNSPSQGQNRLDLLNRKKSPRNSLLHGQNNNNKSLSSMKSHNSIHHFNFHGDSLQSHQQGKEISSYISKLHSETQKSAALIEMMSTQGPAMSTFLISSQRPPQLLSHQSPMKLLINENQLFSFINEDEQYIDQVEKIKTFQRENCRKKPKNVILQNGSMGEDSNGMGQNSSNAMNNGKGNGTSEGKLYLHKNKTQNGKFDRDGNQMLLQDKAKDLFHQMSEQLVEEYQEMNKPLMVMTNGYDSKLPPNQRDNLTMDGKSKSQMKNKLKEFEINGNGSGVAGGNANGGGGGVTGKKNRKETGALLDFIRSKGSD